MVGMLVNWRVFDRLDDRFDGTVVLKHSTFLLVVKEEAIISRTGSRVDVKNSLLVFINNVLQEPGKNMTYKVVLLLDSLAFKRLVILEQSCSTKEPEIRMSSLKISLKLSKRVIL